MLMLALGGVSVDLWRSFAARRALAAVADAAARAGAMAIDEARYRGSGEIVLVPAAAEARARASVGRQPDAGAVRAVHVEANERDVTVSVGGAVPLSLLRLLAPGELAIEVVASATPVRAP